MASEPFLRPDVLVLGAGGVVGEAWMTGVLAGIEDGAGHGPARVRALRGDVGGVDRAHPRGWPAARAARRTRERRRARLGGGRRLEPLAAGDDRRARDRSHRAARSARDAGDRARRRAARSLLLARAPGTRDDLDALATHVDGQGSRFDGRLRVVTVDRDSGKRVVFGAPGAPGASVGQAVHASCAIPWIFRPARIGGREYVDGGVWSLTNMDVAPAGRGTHVLCLSVAAASTASGAARRDGAHRSFGRHRGVARAAQPRRDRAHHRSPTGRRAPPSARTSWIGRGSTAGWPPGIGRGWRAVASGG